MSMFSSFKDERRLSMNHWRYRILHWCFNVEDTTPGFNGLPNTGLPTFLYTHYCPLFHLTNLIAILSPLVLFFKIVTAISRAAYHAFDSVDWSFVGTFLDKIAALMPKSQPKPTKPVSPTKIPNLQKEKNDFAGRLYCWHGSFDDFWGRWSHQYEALSEAEAKTIFADLMPKIEDARKRAEARRKRFRETIVFWVNFSRVFIKWGLNAFYVGLAIGVMYLTYSLFWPFIDLIGSIFGFIHWLFTDSVSFDFFMFMAKSFGYLLTVGTILFFIIRFRIAQRFVSLCWEGLVKITVPLFIFGVFFKWCAKVADAICEFIAMFYEENCPPIKLVSEQEAALEEKGE